MINILLSLVSSSYFLSADQNKICRKSKNGSVLYVCSVIMYSVTQECSFYRRILNPCPTSGFR